MCSITITSADDAQGSVSARNINGKTSDAKITKGTAAKFYATATPASGYSFKGWYIYKDGAANGYLLSTADVIYSYNTLTIPAEYTDGDTLEIKAVFEQDALRNAALTWLGNYDSANTYTISTTDEMRYFAYAVNNLGKDFAGKSVTLEKSLDLTGSTDFSPAGNTVNSFNDSFDGKNNTISGITCTDPSIERSAIFVSTASKSTIANLKVKDCTFGTIAGRSYSGGIVAEARGKIENCTAENISLSGKYCGGITGAAGALAGQINAGDRHYCQRSGQSSDFYRIRRKRLYYAQRQ